MEPIDKLQELFKRFPGIGPRQAERFVYFLLRSSDSYKNELVQTISDLKNSVSRCKMCDRFFVSKSDNAYCPICSSPDRNKALLLIVEKETDIDKIEESSVYPGLYFTSHGTLSPLDSSEKHARYFDRIKKRILSSPNIKEVILAFSTTFEGEYTSKYLKNELEKYFKSITSDIKVSLLGRGLSSGVEIEYADPDTIRFALKNRFS